jgi:hypothetical protein
MQPLEIERVPKTRVLALFEGSAITFNMVPRASLLDLAERLADFGGRHDGALIGVTVRVGAQNREIRSNGHDPDQDRGPR